MSDFIIPQHVVFQHEGSDNLSRTKDQDVKKIASAKKKHRNVKEIASSKPKRAPVPDDVKNEVLRLCKRRCCMCFGLSGKNDPVQGQIAHLDRNPQNADIENLAYFCLECHTKYDTKNNRIQSYTPGEIRIYRLSLYRAMAHDQIEWALTVRGDQSQYDSLKKRVEQAHALLREGGADVSLTESFVE